MKNYYLFLFLSLFFGNQIFAQNPSLVSDIAKAPADWIGSHPNYFTSAGDKIFFLADDGTSAGLEVWRTDGTQSGTQRLGDTNPYTTDQAWRVGPFPISAPVALGDEVFWVNQAPRNEPVHASIWKAGATGIAQKIYDYPNGTIGELTVSGSYLYFIFNNNQLIRIDGTGSEELIYDAGQDLIYELTAAGGRLYFGLRIVDAFSNTTQRVEIWRTVGNTAQFYKTAVADATGTTRWTYLSNFNNQIAYTLSDPYNRDTETTFFAEGFEPITEDRDPYGGRIYDPVVFKNRIYYLNPLANGHFQLKVQINDQTSVIQEFPEAAFNLHVLPSGNEMIIQTASEIWKSNGNAPGTKLLKSFDRGYEPTLFFPKGDEVIFSAWDKNIQSLWRTDGTVDGTEKILDFSSIETILDPVPGLPAAERGFLKDDIFYYSANGRKKGYELWKVDLNTPIDLPPPLPFDLPDLEVYSFNTFSELTGGTTVDLQYWIENTGDGISFGNHTLSIFLSEDKDFTADDLLLGEETVRQRIEAGWTEFASTSVTLPVDLEQDKTYRLFAVIDWHQYIEETNETNNLAFNIFRAITPNLPDLIPIPMIVPAEGVAGQQEVVVLRARNLGTLDADSSSVAVYLSQDRTWDASDILMGEKRIGALDLGELSTRFLGSLSIPNVPPGNYFTLSICDSKNEIIEADETNNLRALPFEVKDSTGVPDLTLTANNLPTSLQTGDSILAQIVVDNIGTGTSSPTLAEVFISTDSILDPATDTLFESQLIPALNRGDQHYHFIRKTAPNLPLGQYFFHVIIDRQGGVTETDETNNHFVFPFEIRNQPPLPDLIPTVTFFNPCNERGDTLTTNFGTKNIGSVKSPSSITRLYLSTDQVISNDDELLLIRFAPELDPGEEQDHSYSVRVPYFTPGQYYLILKSDFRREITESDEMNNTVIIPYEIKDGAPHPDLTVDFINTPSPLFPGDEVVFKIDNIGLDFARGCYAACFISNDEVLSNDDLYVDEVWFTHLNAGDSRTVTFPIDFPQTLTGNKFLILKIDEREVIIEEREDNNTNFTPVNLNPSLSGDIDLELSFDNLPVPNPAKWTIFSPKLTVTNTGTETATGIKIHFPRPTEVIYQGGNEATASQGTFKVYGSENWMVGSLAPNESATLEVNYFRLQDNAFSVYAQVIEADQNDADSTPDNGTCCIANEDDEADVSVAVAKPTFSRRGLGDDSNLDVFDIKASPNPFSSEFILEMISVEKTNSDLLVFDATGKLILKKAVDLTSGYNSISVDASHFSKGVFIVKIEGVGEERLVKITD